MTEQLQGQMDIFDLLKPQNPELEKGTTVYILTLDVLETITIDNIWKREDSMFGYSGKMQGKHINKVFNSKDIGHTVFTDAKIAKEKAENLRDSFVVMRTAEMEVVKERNFIEVCKDNRICISATVKLLKGNMVYSEDWYCYPFLTQLKSEEEAEKEYQKVIKEIKETVDNIVRFEVNVSAELQDMYLVKDGKRSIYRYAVYNVPIKKGKL